MRRIQRKEEDERKYERTSSGFSLLAHAQWMQHCSLYAVRALKIKKAL